MSGKTDTKASLLSLPSGKRKLFGFIIALLFLYAVVPQLKFFHSSLDIIRHANIWWLVAAFCFTFATSLVATGLYVLLAKKRLNYGQTLQIQLASLFVNRLLPAGIGALGINYEYLRKQGHTQAAAGVVVIVNNLIGLIGHAVLLGLIILTTNISINQLAHPHITALVYYVVFAILIISILILVWFKKLRSSVYRTIIDMLKNIHGYRTHPYRLIWALILSISLTSFYGLCLLACIHSVGVSLSIAQVLLVLTSGVVGGAIVPTPGGLGGAEAGLFAGLVAFKLNSPSALAIVLVYRFFTYWLALAVGAVAWSYVRKKHYI